MDIIKAIPENIKQIFCGRMKKAGIPTVIQTACLKWLRYFLDFCGKHHFEPSDPDSGQAFIQKLSDKGQSLENPKEAADTVKVYRQILINEFSEPTPPSAPTNDPAGTGNPPDQTAATPSR